MSICYVFAIFQMYYINNMFHNFPKKTIYISFFVFLKLKIYSSCFAGLIEISTLKQKYSNDITLHSLYRLH